MVSGKLAMDFGPPIFPLLLIGSINVDPHPGCEINESQ